MNADIMTIMWKESKGLFKQGKSRSKSILVLLTPVLMFGIILPIQFREEWLDMGWSLAIALFTPLILIAPTICESFAGERERHTLETLLASRLPDRAILFGKMIVSIAYGWGMTVFLLLMSLVIVNVLMWAGKFQFYQVNIFLADIGLSLLFSGLMVTLGILISLRSATVQSAQQVLMMALVIPIFGLQAIVFLLPTFLPMENIREFLGRFDYDQILLIFLGVLLLVDIGLLLAAMSRFKRSRLIQK
jgi:ABC-2 type transport system permease protein